MNKGIGAGGAKTNYNGKRFETKTNNEIRLMDNGYIKNDIMPKRKNIYDYYLSKTYEDKTVIFLLQNGLKTYIKTNYDINLFRCPDEAYIIKYNDGKQIIKILEKKEQNVEGSVETKLWSGPALKREYELMLEDLFEVHYCFCVNNFLKKKLISTDKKYMILNQILNENEIPILFGEDSDYFDNIDNWINS